MSTAFNPTSPPSVNVQITESKSLTTYHVMQIRLFRPDPNDLENVSIEVRVARGYMNDTTFVKVDETTVNVGGSTAADKLDDLPDAEKTVWENLCHRHGKALLADAVIPAGTY